MGAVVSSGGRVLVCAARYAEDQNAYIIEDQHNIPHVLTLSITQRDGFGLPAYAQNKRKAQRHLLSAIKGHPSRRLLAAAAGTNVDVEIKAKSEREAEMASANLTPRNINKELSAAGEEMLGKSALNTVPT